MAFMAKQMKSRDEMKKAACKESAVTQIDLVSLLPLLLSRLTYYDSRCRLRSFYCKLFIVECLMSMSNPINIMFNAICKDLHSGKDGPTHG